MNTPVRDDDAQESVALQLELRQRTKRRNERGLTTLEWLLIVAAVAGLAALAVVLVQNVIGETSEQLAGSSARLTAAQVAADAVMREAHRDAEDQPEDAKTFGDWKNHYSAKCDRIKITFSDIENLDVTPNFDFKATITAATAVAASSIDVGSVTATADTEAKANKAVAECRVLTS